ncbi:hypothetical protein [Mariniluteicoccus flavus]
MSTKPTPLPVDPAAGLGLGRRALAGLAVGVAAVALSDRPASAAPGAAAIDRLPKNTTPA